VGDLHFLRPEPPDDLDVFDDWDVRDDWDAPEPPPVLLGTCADPGCGAKVWDDLGTLVASCVHWNGEPPSA